MYCFLSRRIHWGFALLASLVCALSLWTNLPNQSTEFGTQGGIYDDPIDSFSEYIIRNSVIDRVRKGQSHGPTLIVTRGYPFDYAYAPEDAKPYFSNRGIQTSVYARIALMLGKRFESHQNQVFQAFRLVNCVLLSALIFAFFFAFLHRSTLSLLVGAVFLHCTGLVLCAGNLYVQTWATFTPLALYGVLASGRVGAYLIGSFLSATLFFMIRYEFATAFALLFVLPVLLCPDLQNRRKIAVRAFLTCVLGFGVALALHHIAVATLLDMPLRDAAVKILGSTQKRMASLTDVPFPFSPAFFGEIQHRWDWPGFAFGDWPYLRKFHFLLLAAFTAFAFRTRRDAEILVWSVAAYISWYICAYQHIMWHLQYDSLLFSMTIQLALAIIWSRRALERISRRPRPGHASDLQLDSVDQAKMSVW